MRIATYLISMILVAAALLLGRLELALLVGGAKALMVGLEFMELRHAARPHAIAFALWVVALTGLLIIVT